MFLTWFTYVLTHLDLVWDKGLYLRTSFYIYAFDWNLELNLQDNDKLYASYNFASLMLEILCLECVLNDSFGHRNPMSALE